MKIGRAQGRKGGRGEGREGGGGEVSRKIRGKYAGKKERGNSESNTKPNTAHLQVTSHLQVTAHLQVTSHLQVTAHLQVMRGVLFRRFSQALITARC